MARLNVNYIDVIQCHDIEFVDVAQIVKETLPGEHASYTKCPVPYLDWQRADARRSHRAALNALKRAGKVGAVGITGLPLPVFRKVLDNVPPGTVDVVRTLCPHLVRVSDTCAEPPLCIQSS
jgi:L-galactose dehydrogenase